MKHFNNKKVAIIFGATGQDGSYLAKSLIDSDYNVFGVTRNLKPCSNHVKLKIEFFNASSTDCYGDTNVEAINENYKFSPKSPYASGKASCSMAVDIYRNAYGLYAVSGILSNHESVLIDVNFVTMISKKHQHIVQIDTLQKLQ